jgi:hypothetical protein
VARRRKGEVWQGRGTAQGRDEARGGEASQVKAVARLGEVRPTVCEEWQGLGETRRGEDWPRRGSV